MTALSVVALAAAGSVLAGPAAAATSNPTPAAGLRRGATRLSFTISGTASLSVDVGTGNALFSDQLLTLPGITSDVPVTLVYNSSVWGSGTPSAVTGDTGSGWAITGFDQRLVTNADGSVTYYGANGLSGVFTSSSGVYSAPPQFQATLATISGGWTLTDHGSQSKLTFNSDGRLSSAADRNGNGTTFSYDPYGLPTQMLSTRGGTSAEKVTVARSGNRLSTLTQTSSTLGSRTITFGYSSGGHLASVKDSAGGTTSFSSNAEGASGSDTGQVKQITSPIGASTWLTFDTSHRVTSVSQANPATHGGAGESVSRLTYPTSTQTLVADPTTNQSSAVSAVPHTTYGLTSDQRVSSATDPDGNTRSATFTTLGQIKTSTPAAGGATTFTYGANSGESLTSVATAAGATGSASYGNSGGNAYLPSSTKDDAGNSTYYTYNGAGNPLTAAQASSTGPQAKVAYNSLGQATSSTSPGASVSTTYGYDGSTHNLTSMTPPSGTSLGARTYSWDDFGRLSTASDGRGNTTTYSYDGLDRITKVHYSAGASDVTYTYDANGRVKTRTDGSGTTTNTWDDLGHLTSVVNTAGGGTQSYTYDLAGALKSAVTGAGTRTYGYDAAHQLTSMTYPQSGSSSTPKYVAFANDGNGRRTDTWMQSDSTHSVWAAHSHTDYDGSGRVTRVIGQTGPASGPATVLDQSACYAAGSVAPACSTSTGVDRSKVQWIKDNKTGEVTTYTYDDHARLTKATVIGGSNPRTYTFGYDAAGNRTSASVTGSSPSSQTLTFNAANQITSSGYSYDGAGNQTAAPGRSTTVNTAGQQTKAVVGSATATYIYAGTNQNEVLSEVVTGGSSPGTYKLTYGHPDAQGLPEIESVGYTSGSSSLTGYVFHDPSGTPVMLQTNNQVTCLYMYDITGNPTALTTSFDTISYVLRFDPYGASVRTDTTDTGNGGTTLNPYLFHRGIQDRATGLLKFGGRWYDAKTGTWTQQDTLNAPLDPGNANRYAYVGDDPINNTDPTGRSYDWNSVAYGSIGVYLCYVGSLELPAFGLGCAIYFLVSGGAVGDALSYAQEGYARSPGYFTAVAGGY